MNTSPPKKPRFTHFSQRVPPQHTLLALGLLGLLVTPIATAARDPFWPIGHVPSQAPTQKTDVAPAQSNPVISTDTWTLARKTLVINGYTQTALPETNVRRTFVMINRQNYAVGDTLSITNLNMRFTWRIESLENLNLCLTQVAATPLTTDQNNSQKQNP